MIIRKPYAFLIKYFRRINMLLLALVGLTFYQTNQLYSFVKNYMNTSIYNSVIDSISNYTTSYIYIAFFATIIISIILGHLLRRKDKPYISYVYIIIVNILVMSLYIYTNYYFTFIVGNGFDLVSARIMNDLFFIATLPYYPMLFILIIRSMGIDLKSFGFMEDKEFVEIKDEDNEEVEVEVGFDKDRLKRKIKYYFRHTKYFILEHKVPLSIVFILVFGIFSFNFYNYFYVENRIYSMNETFNSNYYDITVNNSYLTDKDYAGNIVSEKDSYFIIIDATFTNKLNVDRHVDIDKMLLFIDNDYYVPTTKFNEYFQDMGNLYNNKNLKANSTTSYVLIYEVPKPKDNANFILKYQDAYNGKTGKLVQVKIKILDISAFKEKGNSRINKEFTIPLNLQEKVTFKISGYKILNSINYTYQSCNPDSCPIYEAKVNAPKGYKILYMRGSYDNKTTLEYVEFLKKYAKIRYRVNGKLKEDSIKVAVNKNYLGNHIYLLVNDDIKDSNYISLVFTVRTYRYNYVIKGE